MIAEMPSAFISWQPHVEVWMLILAVLGLGIYVRRVIEPTMVAAGEQPISAAQIRWFTFGVVILWLASDWPLHDLSEERLFVLHMVQHLLLTFVIPPVFLLATPTWLARLMLGSGWFGRWFSRVLCRPVVAGVAYNAVVAISHAAPVVNTTVRIGPLHYLLHLLLVALAFAMWMSVCGPLPERRLSPPAQMVYLFMMSVLPTIPAAFLTVADNPLYRVYDHEPRLWGISVTTDQQAAGLVMKLVGGAYLWILIAWVFFRWAARTQRAERAYQAERDRSAQSEPLGPLTWAEVKAELQYLGPGPTEP